MADRFNMRQGSNTFFNVLVIAFNVLAISAMFCAAKNFRGHAYKPFEVVGEMSWLANQPSEQCLRSTNYPLPSVA